MTASGVNIANIIKVLAPGNLFTGTFTFTKSGVLGASSYGTVGFGQPYTYTARPTALELTYKTSSVPTFIQSGVMPMNLRQDMTRQALWYALSIGMQGTM